MSVRDRLVVPRSGDAAKMRPDPIVYHCPVHAWHGRQHFYQGLARSFACSRPVLYISGPVTWPRGPDMAVYGRRIKGGYLSFPEPGLAVIQPVIPRGARFRSIAKWSEVLIAQAALAGLTELGLVDRRLVLWCYSPGALPLVKRLPAALSVYWTGDDPPPGERPLLESVDQVFAISPEALARNRAVVGERAVEMPMAIDPEPFFSARAQGNIPPDLMQLPRPIIGYGGGLNQRIDWSLLEAVARSTRGTLVLVGPALDDQARQELPRLTSLPNALWLGHRDENLAPSYISAFDVGLIPYLRNRFNDGSNPVKFYEYLAAGLPVVSTRLPALQKHANTALFADEPIAFTGAIEAALATGHDSPEQVKRRQDVASAHSYDALIARVDTQLQGFRAISPSAQIAVQ